jgi:hypothetical protein
MSVSALEDVELHAAAFRVLLVELVPHPEAFLAFLREVFPVGLGLVLCSK